MDDDGSGWLPNKSKDEDDDEGFFQGWMLSFETTDEPREIIGNSAYVFFLMRDMVAPVYASIVVLFQIYLMVIYMYDFLSMSEIGTVVRSGKTAVEITWAVVGAAFLLTVRTLPGIGRGMNLVMLAMKRTPSPNPNAHRKYWKLWVVGCFELVIALLTVAVGAVAASRATTSRTVITSSVVAVLIESIDESAFGTLRYFTKPKWYDRKLDELVLDYGGPKGLVGGEVRQLRNSVLEKDD